MRTKKNHTVIIQNNIMDYESYNLHTYTCKVFQAIGNLWIYTDSKTFLKQVLSNMIVIEVWENGKQLDNYEISYL